VNYDHEVESSILRKRGIVLTEPCRYFSSHRLSYDDEGAYQLGLFNYRFDAAQREFF